MKKLFLLLSIFFSVFSNAQTVTPRSGASTASLQAVGINTLLTINNSVKSNSVVGISTSSANIGGFTSISTTTVTMSVAGSYATGDYMGTSTTPQTFTNVVRSSGGSAIIKSIFISDKIVTANVNMELWLLSATFTAPTDNAAWAITDSEATTVLAVIPLSSSNWYASSNNQVYYDGSLCVPLKLSSGTSVYYALVARGTTPSFTSLDLAIGLGILQD